jgi:hypothetical protein
MDMVRDCFNPKCDAELLYKKDETAPTLTAECGACRWQYSISNCEADPQKTRCWITSLPDSETALSNWQTEMQRLHPDFKLLIETDSTGRLFLRIANPMSEVGADLVSLFLSRRKEKVIAGQLVPLPIVSAVRYYVEHLPDKFA